MTSSLMFAKDGTLRLLYWISHVQKAERMVTKDENKAAMFDIGDNKAPDHDGYTSTFFKEVNATLITLIHKVANLTKATETNIMLQCRLIQDNILITQELLRRYNRKNGHKRCAVKIDVDKAYDTVNWEFLKEALRRFRFHSKMIHWIMTCVSSSAYSICVNMSRYGYLKVWVCGSGKKIIRLVQPGKLPMKYLGVPLMAQRISVTDCSILVDRVKRKLICKPKDKRWLGIKPLHEWNIVLLTKRIWNIAAKKDTLWVKWVFMVKLKGKSIWDVEIENADSWGFKNLMEIKDTVKSKIIHVLGNGRNTSMWYDKWHPQGPLCAMISRRARYEAGLSKSINVSDMIEDGNWK
nr:hypothetical protein [Tanacetum cinerariifolium]